MRFNIKRNLTKRKEIKLRDNISKSKNEKLKKFKIKNKNNYSLFKKLQLLLKISDKNK